MAERQQPIWKVTVRGEHDPAAVEDLLARAPLRQAGGTGLRIERADVGQGSTTIFVSGARADAETLLGTLGQPRARRQKLVPSTVEELQRTETEPARPRKRRH